MEGRLDGSGSGLLGTPDISRLQMDLSTNTGAFPSKPVLSAARLQSGQVLAVWVDNVDFVVLPTGWGVHALHITRPLPFGNAVGTVH